MNLLFLFFCSSVWVGRLGADRTKESGGLAESATPVGALRRRKKRGARASGGGVGGVPKNSQLGYSKQQPAAPVAVAPW